jgi:hypothetical protein
MPWPVEENKCILGQYPFAEFSTCVRSKGIAVGVLEILLFSTILNKTSLKKSFPA